jgi:hypothetical protein
MEPAAGGNAAAEAAVHSRANRQAVAASNANLSAIYGIRFVYAERRRQRGLRFRHDVPTEDLTGLPGRSARFLARELVLAAHCASPSFNITRASRFSRGSSTQGDKLITVITAAEEDHKQS